MIEDNTTDRRADEDAKADDREAHAHAGPDKPSVRRELHEDARWQGDERAGEETEEQSEHDNTAQVVYTDEAEDENASDECAEEEHVQPTRSGGEEVGNYATEDRRGVEDGEQVETQLGVGNVLGD